MENVKASDRAVVAGVAEHTRDLCSEPEKSVEQERVEGLVKEFVERRAVSDDVEQLDKEIYRRIMKRFDAMGDEAKAMMRLYWLLQLVGGVTWFTPAAQLADDLSLPVKVNDPAYKDPWVAGFCDCLEMVVSHS